MRKRLLIVGGPNGAGKTTLANAYLRGGGWLYLGADKIAYELRPEDPESVPAAAGRLFVGRLDRAIRDGVDTIVESTLSGRSIGRNITRAKQRGFEVEIAFAFVDEPNTSIARIAHRVRVGGHHVPDNDVVRRFYRCAHNFWLDYRYQVDRWTLYDNRHLQPKPIAIGNRLSSQILERGSLNEFLRFVEQSS